MEKLAKITKAKKEEVVSALEELAGDYANRGFTLIRHEDKWQLGSSPENSRYVEDLVKNEFTEELSRAALETLSIIAYKGPLTRAEVEYIRGVNSSFTLRNLLMRGLVERIDNPKDARSYLYSVGAEFLKYLGVTRIQELPHFTEFEKEKMEIFETKPGSNSSTVEHSIR